MLAILGSLNYKPWFALAEYVDNSLQSFMSDPVQQSDIGQLSVDIRFEPADGGLLTIDDNANGIQLSDFPRAFRPAELPPDRTGLSEFGMGMKSASCWFAKKWSVTTTVRGEAIARRVSFDIDKIVRENIENLEIEEIDEESQAHYTKVRLWDLNHPLATRTLGKIKEHLTDIYRVFLRNESMYIRFRGELLEFVDPEILVTPPFDEPLAEPVAWTKDIDFDFGDGLSVYGFAALLATGQQSRAGFSLFRRGRVVEGSGDELYKPTQIYGAGNTYRSQRLFGELHLDGFDVSHTKDGFQWFDSEGAFLELLREHLDEPPVALLRQAEGFRARASKKQQEAIVVGAIDRTADSLKEGLEAQLPEFDQPVSPPPLDLGDDLAPIHTRHIQVKFRGVDWSIAVEARADGPADNWLTYSDSTPSPGTRVVQASLNLGHPFLVRFAQKDPDAFEALLRVGVALVISDAVGRMDDLPSGAVMRNVRELLNGSLSKP
jgi:hypothetical protein